MQQSIPGKVDPKKIAIWTLWKILFCQKHPLLWVGFAEGYVSPITQEICATPDKGLNMYCIKE